MGYLNCSTAYLTSLSILCLVRIRGRLKKLIARRPEADVLRRTGIMQGTISELLVFYFSSVAVSNPETVFGCDLSKLTEREKSPVPQFLRHFIEHIEKKGLTVVGLYRLSGNAAEIQKLRYLVEESESMVCVCRFCL